MASEADRLRALAMNYRNKALDKCWTASGQMDFLTIAARYEQAAAMQEIADAITHSRSTVTTGS